MAGPVRKARMARKEKVRKRKADLGTQDDLRAVLWKAIRQLEDHMDRTAEKDSARLTKLTHAVSQASASYLRVVEVGELEARVAALEEQEQEHE